MIIFFSTSLSWRATAVVLLVQLALGLLQSSFQPYQVLRSYFSTTSATQQPASWLQPTAHANIITDPAPGGMLPSLLSLAVVAGVLGMFCYVARSEALRREPDRPARPRAGPRQQQPLAPQSSTEVAAAVNRLPIEEFLDRDQLAALSARELKAKLEQRHVSVHRVLEKDDAIAELLAAGGSTAEMCVVCFADYARGDLLRRLRCGHAFHCECVDRWLLGQRGGAPCCPVCKDPVL